MGLELFDNFSVEGSEQSEIAGEGGGVGGEDFFASSEVEINGIAGVGTDLIKEEADGATVPFTEGVEGVQLGGEPSKGFDELGLFETDEVVAALQLEENLVGVRLDVISIGKGDGAIGLSDVDRADFASKIVNVTEQRAVKTE